VHGEGIDDRRRVFEGESNVIDRNTRHFLKHNSAIIPTKLGIQIERREQETNANFLICESDDADSKVPVTSEKQHQKHDSHRISTEDGIQITFSVSRPTVRYSV
jgi:hypothetical protein